MFCCYRLPLYTKKYLVTSSAQAADTCDTNKQQTQLSKRINNVSDLLYHAVGKTQFLTFTPDKHKETVSLEATIGEEQNCRDTFRK